MIKVSNILGKQSDDKQSTKPSTLQKVVESVKGAVTGKGTKPTFDEDSGYVPQFKKGGTVKKTGLAKVHKGEKVLTKMQAKKYVSRKRT